MIGDTPEAEQNIKVLYKLFSKHKDCFPLPGKMSCTMVADEIDEPMHFFLKPRITLPQAQPKKFSLPEAAAATKYHDQMVAAGKMRKSSSPISSNPLLVAKKDGSLCFIVIFIPINCLIAPCAWPIPNPMAEISKLQGCNWMSCWDCKDGYLQSPIAESCHFLTAVAFPDGLWEYNVLPMGLIDLM